VSGLSGSFRSWRGGQVERLIQTTAELLPGFSGGPLVDAEGRVIGINSWNFGRGISRAVPLETADRVAESLRVVTVEAGGPAQTAGLLQGDTIVTLDGDPVRHLDELFSKLGTLEVGSAHQLAVVRAGERKDVAVTVGERQS
ncbi:MAG: PDZ domain-containing protein, partial [Chloroflexi bacterium]